MSLIEKTFSIIYFCRIKSSLDISAALGRLTKQRTFPDSAHAGAVKDDPAVLHKAQSRPRTRQVWGGEAASSETFHSFNAKFISKLSLGSETTFAFQPDVEPGRLCYCLKPGSADGVTPPPPDNTVQSVPSRAAGQVYRHARDSAPAWCNQTRGVSYNVATLLSSLRRHHSPLLPHS